MKSKESHCRIEIEDMDFFVPDDNSYVSYKVYQDDKLLVYSVVTVTEEADPELCAEKEDQRKHDTDPFSTACGYTSRAAEKDRKCTICFHFRHVVS